MDRLPEWVYDLCSSVSTEAWNKIPEDLQDIIAEKMYKENYQCSYCNEVFRKGLTDEEAEEQYKREFVGRPALEHDTPVVCDTCYKAMVSIVTPAQALKEELEKIDQAHKDIYHPLL